MKQQCIFRNSDKMALNTVAWASRPCDSNTPAACSTILSVALRVILLSVCCGCAHAQLQPLDMIDAAIEMPIGAIMYAPQGEHTGEHDQKPVATMAVQGQSQLKKPTDQLRITLGVVTHGRDVREVSAQNADSMKQVIKAIEKAGLSKDEYETGRFNVQPMMDYNRPQNAGRDWKPRITGYQVTNKINIKTKQLELAGEIIAAATDAGANSVDSIGFDLADSRIHRNEAIATATSFAMSDAKVLAAAANVRLVRIISIRLDNAGYQPPPMPMYAGRMAAAEAGSGMAPPINPGDITITANVSIVYEIAANE